MKDLFNLLLEISCTEIHLGVDGSKVTFWSEDRQSTITVSSDNLDSLTRELLKHKNGGVK